jgi:large subunit ribosomal protein L14
MLQLRSILTVADNTGAKKAVLVGIPDKGNRRYAYLGEVVTVVIKEVVPHGMVNKSEIHRAVIVRTKKEKRRSDGSYIRFDDNACVILAGKETKDPKGTRIFGPIAKEVKDNGFSKIASLAEEMY